MAEVVIPVKLEILIADAIKESKKAADQLSKEFEQVGKNTKGTENAAKLIAGFLVTDVIISGVRKLAAAVGEFVSEAAEAEQISVELAQALKLSGSFSEKAVDEFSALADELARVSRFDDDVILGQVKIAKQFNVSNEEAKKLIRAAVELSALTGKDLNTSVEILGRSLDGTAGKLNEQVVGMRALTPAALAAGGAIDLILKRFGGTSLASIDNFNGMIGMVEKQLKNVQEGFGTAFVDNDSTKIVLSELISLLDDFLAVIEENKDALKVLVTEGIIFATKAFATFISVVEILDGVFRGLEYIFDAVATVLLTIQNALVSIITLDLSGLKKSLDYFGTFSELNRKSDFGYQKRAEGYNRVNEALGNILNKLDDQFLAEKKIQKATEEQNESLQKQQRIAAAMAEARKAFVEQVDKLSTSAISAIAAEYAATLKKNYELFRNTSKYAELDYQIRAAYDKKIADERDRLLKEHVAKLQSYVSNPAEGAFGPAAEGGSEVGARLVGGASQVLQGRQGAVSIMSGIAEAAGQAFLGIPGIGQLFSLLAQGPEQVKAMVKEFIKSLPEIIVAVAESIPAIIDGIIEALPALIEGIIKALPRIAIAMARTFILYMPEAIYKAVAEGFGRFFTELYKGAGKFVEEIVNGAGQFVEKLLQALADGIGKVLDGLNPFSGSNSGLGGFVSGVGDFFSGVFGWKGGGAGDMAADGGGFQKGGSVGYSYSGAQPMQVVVQIGQRQLAQALFDINRQGYRTS